MRGQISLEALVTLSAFLALVLALLYSFISLSEGAADFGEGLSARSCAFETAELAGYYYLDGRGSHFPLGIAQAIGMGGEISCRRGAHNATSKTLVVDDGLEPV